LSQQFYNLFHYLDYLNRHIKEKHSKTTKKGPKSFSSIDDCFLSHLDSAAIFTEKVNEPKDFFKKEIEDKPATSTAANTSLQTTSSIKDIEMIEYNKSINQSPEKALNNSNKEQNNEQKEVDEVEDEFRSYEDLNCDYAQTQFTNFTYVEKKKRSRAKSPNSKKQLKTSFEKRISHLADNLQEKSINKSIEHIAAEKEKEAQKLLEKAAKSASSRRRQAKPAAAAQPTKPAAENVQNNEVNNIAEVKPSPKKPTRSSSRAAAAKRKSDEMLGKLSEELDKTSSSIAIKTSSTKKSPRQQKTPSKKPSNEPVITPSKRSRR
jgi:hypothetical protein